LLDGLIEPSSIYDQLKQLSGKYRQVVLDIFQEIQTSYQENGDPDLRKAHTDVAVLVTLLEEKEVSGMPKTVEVLQNAESTIQAYVRWWSDKRDHYSSDTK